MKKLFLGALATCLIFAGSVSQARAEHIHYINDPLLLNHGLINLEHQEVIQGRVTEVRNGQVFLQLADGSIAEIPHMAIFWGTEPREPLASVAVGDEVLVFLPEDYTMRVVNRNDANMMILGSYEGVWRLPGAMVAAWEIDGDDLGIAEH
jgi:hypothetical protein